MELGILTFNYLDLKFVFNDRKHPLIASFIDIFQFVQFFAILAAIWNMKFWVLYFWHKFAASHLKNSLLPSFIKIRQFMKIFKILGRHIETVILNFVILTSNSYSATQKTFKYQV